MKKIALILLLLIGINTAQSAEILNGTIVRVYPRKPISTENYQIGDFVYFVNPIDMWQGNEILIPESTVFTGHIATLHMPVQGVNASMSMKINKMILPNGKQYDIDATITHKGKEILGGEQTNPASYNTSIHYIAPFRGVKQWVPSGEWEFGSHITLTQKNELYITFTNNLILED
ncbi:hypothetical protein IKA92_03420 [bacterium]|nr:hypothetical protein [bacterium]